MVTDIFRMSTTEKVIAFMGSFSSGLVVGLVGGYILRQYFYMLFCKRPHNYSQAKKDDDSGEATKKPTDSEWEDIESEDDSKGVNSAAFKTRISWVLQ